MQNKTKLTSLKKKKTLVHQPTSMSLRSQTIKARVIAKEENPVRIFVKANSKQLKKTSKRMTEKNQQKMNQPKRDMSPPTDMDHQASTESDIKDESLNTLTEKPILAAQVSDELLMNVQGDEGEKHNDSPVDDNEGNTSNNKINNQSLTESLTNSCETCDAPSKNQIMAESDQNNNNNSNGGELGKENRKQLNEKAAVKLTCSEKNIVCKDAEGADSDAQSSANKSETLKRRLMDQYPNRLEDIDAFLGHKEVS